MSALAIDTVAVAECVRDTLELFLADHPGMEGTDDLEVGKADGGDSFAVTINGISYRVQISGPGDQ
jgi:hypothetical protein